MFLGIPNNRNVISSSNQFLIADCEASVSIGDCAYVESYDETSKIYKVNTANIREIRKMPAIGIVISKETDITCTVQMFGRLEGIYGGMTITKPVFVGADGRATQVPPKPHDLNVNSDMFLQMLGSSIGQDVILLTMQYGVTKLIV